MKIKNIIGIIVCLWICSAQVVGQTTISIPDGVATVGESIQIPVLLNTDGSEDILGVFLQVDYNSAEMVFEGQVKTESISDSLTTAVNDQGGSILISMASIHPVTESGVLIFLEFTPLLFGDTELVIQEYRINEEASVFPEAVSSYKVFDVGGNQAPIAVQIPDTLTFFSSDTLNLVVDENLFADPEDDFEDLIITFSIEPEVVFAMFNPATNILTITTADYVGLATLSLRVEDLDGGVLEEEIILDIQLKVSNEFGEETPGGFTLNQNYPNPFNPSTNISYQIAQAGPVQLDVYSMNGQLVATLINGMQASGSHTVSFDASALSSGIYIYRLTSNGYTETKKMMLIK